jgi:hypothetical protein
MNQIDRILDVIDHGVGLPSAGVVNATNTAFCAREGCCRRPEDGHDFCTPCLAWLRGHTDEEPPVSRY